MGIEPTQPAWKAGILAIELHPQTKYGQSQPTFRIISALKAFVNTFFEKLVKKLKIKCQAHVFLPVFSISQLFNCILFCFDIIIIIVKNGLYKSHKRYSQKYTPHSEKTAADRNPA